MARTEKMFLVVIVVSFLILNYLHAEVIPLEPITVSAISEFKQESVFNLGYSARVYTDKDIENTSATSILDFLKRTQDVNVADWYGTGVKANVDLMGFGDNANSNILVLINGRKVNIPYIFINIKTT